MTDHDLDQPNCFKRKCKHFIGIHQPDENEDIEMLICQAFPGGIPFEISYGDNPHNEVHPTQDNDIVYEKQED